MKNNKTNQQRGFTLIELMIVIAILAILAAIALASYRPYIIKNNRKAAIADIMALQQTLERQYTLNNGAYRYDATDTGAGEMSKAGTCATADAYSSGNNPVVYSFNVASTNTRQAYTITATPCAGSIQTEDKCGNLTIDNKGEWSVSGSGVTKKECI